MGKILFVGNTAWSMYNFRRFVFEAFLKKGHLVYVVSPKDRIYQRKLADMGCRCISLSIKSKGVNPLEDINVMVSLYKIIKNLKPDHCFFYTIKPNIYGSMAASCLRVPHVAVTTGLGYTFITDNLVSKIANILYKVSLRKARQVWFLNADDQEAFLEKELIKEQQAFILNGEGVDVEHFNYRPYQTSDLSFLLVARMLWDKGVGQFVEAAREIKKTHPNITFKLLGYVGVDNPNAISKKQMDEWIEEGVVEYLGITQDVRPFIEKSSCIVLPSYYGEGVPLSLLEGAAIGRPVITTNSVGCKETVEDGKTGFLCEPKNVSSLVNAMEKIIRMPEEELIKMGYRARKRVEKVFDVRLVIDKYVEIVSQIKKQI